MLPWQKAKEHDHKSCVCTTCAVLRRKSLRAGCAVINVTRDQYTQIREKSCHNCMSWDPITFQRTFDVWPVGEIAILVTMSLSPELNRLTCFGGAVVLIPSYGLQIIMRDTLYAL